MRIAVSADCFASFTSGFPVRGMMLNLIKKRSYDTFLLYYTKRPKPPMLHSFYDEINELPNVEVRYFKYGRKTVALRRLLKLPLVNRCDFDLFINPGNLEVWPNIKVPTIGSIADFSTLKGLSTGRYAWFFKYYSKWTLKYTFSKLDVIVPISHFTENDLLSFWPQFKPKLNVVHNGIDDMWFDEHVEPCPINPFSGQKYFIWWGLISRRKNIDNLIKAYNLAKHENPGLPNLLLVGKVEGYMEHIKDTLSDNIQNIPFQDNYVLKGLVRHSEGLIFPSFYEGFGLPVVEAFSQGVPVACSNVTSLPEVADGYALLFDPDNIKEMKDKMLQLAVSEYDSASLKRYAHSFSYKKAAEKYSEIIDALKSKV